MLKSMILILSIFTTNVAADEINPWCGVVRGLTEISYLHPEKTIYLNTIVVEHKKSSNQQKIQLLEAIKSGKELRLEVDNVGLDNEFVSKFFEVTYTQCLRNHA